MDNEQRRGCNSDGLPVYSNMTQEFSTIRRASMPVINVSGNYAYSTVNSSPDIWMGMDISAPSGMLHPGQFQVAPFTGLLDQSQPHLFTENPPSVDSALLALLSISKPAVPACTAEVAARPRLSAVLEASGEAPVAETGNIQVVDTTIPASPATDEAEHTSATSTPVNSMRYQCKICWKYFTRPSSLTTHVYTHTGEKPHKCTFPGCGRGFSVASNMRRHAKLHGDLAPRSRRKGRNIPSCHPYEERLIHMQVHPPHMFPPMHGFRFGPPPVLYVQPSDSNLLPPGAHGMVPTQPISTGGIIGPLANAMDLPQPSPLAVSHPYPSWDNLVFRRLSAPAMPPPQVPWP